LFGYGFYIFTVGTACAKNFDGEHFYDEFSTAKLGIPPLWVSVCRVLQWGQGQLGNASFDLS